MKSITALAVLAGLLPALAAVGAHAADAYYDGWVSHVQGRQLEICFPHGALPAPAQTVQLLRTRYVTVAKGQARAIYLPAGRARIESAGATSCDSATLLSGEAARGDHVRTG